MKYGPFRDVALGLAERLKAGSTNYEVTIEVASATTNAPVPIAMTTVHYNIEGTVRNFTFCCVIWVHVINSEVTLAVYPLNR